MLKRKKPHILSEIPMAPMADIAFLLLVFFLTSTVFDVLDELQQSGAERISLQTLTP